jgi:oligoribonuclease NrnB/cAMP/cGMP phosphodiesterase (DHH superfamily)
MKNCHHIITHKDLDGISSLLVFKWYHENDSFHYKPVTNINVEIQLEEYIKDFVNVHNLYVFDLALREQFYKYDLPFITFFDHHKKSEKYKSNFKNAKIIHKEYTSNTKLLYKYYNKIYDKDLSKEKKSLILLVDDYDSDERKIQQSQDLNILFWALYRNNINKFIEKYKDGFFGFSENESEIIFNIKSDAIQKIKNFPFFTGELNIQGKIKKVISSFGENTNLLTLDYILQNNDADLLFFINTEKQKVSLKQKKSDDMIDLSIFAQKYCEGDGHYFSAGGKLTDIFMELTKKFKPL